MPLSRKIHGWLQALLLCLLSIDVTVLPQVLPPALAVKVTACIAITIGVLKALLGLYAQTFNTDGTPQSVPFEPKR